MNQDLLEQLLLGRRDGRRRDGAAATGAEGGRSLLPPPLEIFLF
jgi:hypothetical protein